MLNHVASSAIFCADFWEFSDIFNLGGGYWWERFKFFANNIFVGVSMYIQNCTPVFQTVAPTQSPQSWLRVVQVQSLILEQEIKQDMRSWDTLYPDDARDLAFINAKCFGLSFIFLNVIITFQAKVWITG